jgi:2-methylisocitrate lyase-like PEP mutase family enzyme
MKTQREKAEEFRALHNGKHMLILPNAWDVPSARIFEDQGFPAVATSSAGLMVSLGYPDGESIHFPEFLSAVRRISRVIGVPLSVDAVGGFGYTPAEVAASIKHIIESGAVGVNIEDFEHTTQKLYPLDKQLEKLTAVKKIGDLLGVPLVINARTDALRYAQGDEETRLGEAIRRAKAFGDAGVDCVYPMGLVKADQIAKFTKELNLPVNVMVRRGLPTIQELEKLGVSRVSFGPSASYAAMGLLKRASKEILEKGTYAELTEGAISFDELNSLAVAKKP